MIDSLLEQIFSSQWRVIVIVSLLLLGTTELGFRFGLFLHRTKDEARRGHIGGIQGAIFGLLGLLLGFTFAMAVGRFETRRGLVLGEANAIGTTYLRSSLMPDSRESEMKKLLRDYVDIRLEFHRTGIDDAKLQEVERRTMQSQQALWDLAVAAAKESPSPLTASFITSLNETIDYDAKHLNALRSHVPGAVWLLVLSVALCGSCVCGYAAGASGTRSGFANVILPLLVAVAITLIADLDRPRRGLIGISQRPLLDLQASMHNDARANAR